MSLIRLSLSIVILVSALAALAACGGSATPEPAASPAAPEPTSAPTQGPPTDQPDATQPAPGPTATSTTPPATPTTPPATSEQPPATEPPVATAPSAGRQTGEVEGISFVVGEGSTATFTVEEQLSRLPLPNDAVVRTESLTGSVHLDGRDSVVEIHLQDLHSDSDFRDRYIRSRMFGDHPTGVFTVKGLDQLPDGFADGESVTEQIEGELLIRGITAPLTFEVEARDDGDVIYILGRTTFTWDGLQIPKPTAQSVVSLNDEVAVEVLLAVRPG